MDSVFERILILRLPREQPPNSWWSTNGSIYPWPPKATHRFFQLVAHCDQHGSLLITSNHSVGEGDQVFGDPVVTTVTLDHLCTTAPSRTRRFKIRVHPLGPFSMSLIGQCLTLLNNDQVKLW